MSAPPTDAGGLAPVPVLSEAIKAERDRIANYLEAEADLAPCKEDGEVYRSAAWLVRADFSYEEAERLEVAAEQGFGPEETKPDYSCGAWDGGPR